VEQRNLKAGAYSSRFGTGLHGGMSEFYAASDEDESTTTIHHATELGVAFLILRTCTARLSIRDSLVRL